jgi:hypothetical protein
VDDLLRAIKPAVFVGSSRKEKGIATPQRHVDLIRQRLREAEAIHKLSKEAKP